MHALNFIVDIPARRLYHHLVAFTLPHQSPRNRRAHRNQVGLNIRFVLTNNAIGDGLIVFYIDQIDRRPKNDFTGVGNCADINDLSVRQLVFNILNTALSKALLLSSRMVLSIFFQIAVLSRLAMA